MDLILSQWNLQPGFRCLFLHFKIGSFFFKFIYLLYKFSTCPEKVPLKQNLLFFFPTCQDLCPSWEMLPSEKERACPLHRVQDLYLLLTVRSKNDWFIQKESKIWITNYYNLEFLYILVSEFFS